MKNALIVVDVQRDFCKGGALEVPEGDKVVEPLNKYIEVFEATKNIIVFTRDWHPSDHISFKERGGPWPPHCIKNTLGAEFHPKLNFPSIAIVVSKANERDKEAYSGFENTGLQELLKELKIEKVFVGGLATDYCVKNTVLDALKLNFKTYLLVDAIRGVNVNPKDSEFAIDEMKKKGAIPTVFEEIRKLLG
ncbi:MAG: bifunctional nicotinamidase/pyrazinamidase [Thermoproteota archaeon]|nr:bifunctional nicotinamidase/pyrazinamidase [Candidatus Brockarchaeota archaeon]MBO3763457.1 bifunctional nicotinamidase/pyrazinamidase [Candidatus Brockarchaeota archaeon]MBO3800850.1 bifunctional nicotinamidase/pyrazinamidase [Candidatus Brockarchaeota archaeon]